MKAESEPVDVIVVTRNSGITLAACLAGIRKTIPVHHLIVADGGSTDDTLKIAAENDCVILKDTTSISTARYAGAEAADTRLVCYVDSDTVLLPGWYQKLRGWFSIPKVVWVQGFAINSSSIAPGYGVAKSLVLRNRGFVTFGHTLVDRRVIMDAAKNWSSDSRSAEEDIWLLKELNRLGLKVITDPSFVQAVHLPDCFLHDLRAAYRGGVANSRKGKISAAARCVYFLYNGTVQVLAKPSVSVLVANVLMGQAYLLGAIFPKNRSINAFVQSLNATSERLGMARLDSLTLQGGDLSSRKEFKPILQKVSSISLRRGRSRTGHSGA